MRRLLFAVAVGLLWLLPSQTAVSDDVAAAKPPRAIQPLDDMSGIEKTNLAIMQGFTSVWFFTLGACMGSFLNVVIYRLPAGLKLGSPPSRCPVCETRIERRDNLPIIGWLRLRGRCRACGTKISPRYPLIELLVGMLLLLFLHVELLSGGKNLPYREPNTYAGVVWIIWYTKWDLVGIYFFHLFLLCVLLAATLMHVDGHAVPKRFWRFAFAVGLIGSTLFATLHPIPFITPRPQWLEQLRWSITLTDKIFSGWPFRLGIGLDGLADAVAGTLSGGALGLVMAACWKGTQPRVESADRDLVLASALVGQFLGWQGSVALCFIGIPLQLALRFATPRRLQSARWQLAVLAGTLTCLLLVWKPAHKFLVGIENSIG